MVKQIYTQSFNILTRMPLKLWGLSLLSGFLTLLILLLGGIPIITIPVAATLSAGAAAVYLDGYNGRDVVSDRLFSGFKSFPHVAGGMCWEKLWVLLWLLVPVAGPVLAVIKSLSYAFTPYILTQEPEINATEALRQSMERTKGYKGNMFLALIVPVLAYFVVTLLLSLLALIPFVGVVFTAVSLIVSLVFSLFAPLFLGLVQAGFYEYAKHSVYRAPSVSTNAPKLPCTVCGHENPAGTMFCGKCGSKIE